ncbi:MAG: hypothetical protein E6Q97_09665 [Desulfurellales bacterium]|nr:MAG: hypothetical protein E6Q97_09665 [Desulfurellales bacterium]
MSESVASDGKVNGPGFVALPPEHILRKDVDLVLLPGGQLGWISVGTSAGESVGASAYEHACCLAGDWPDETNDSLQVQTESDRRWITTLQKTIQHQSEKLEINKVLLQSSKEQCVLLTKIVSDRDQEIKELREQIAALQSPVSPEPNSEEHEVWEVQDRVPSRTGVDEWRVCLKSGDISDWSETITMNVMHGYATEDGHFEVRCRRKDLPPLEHSTNPTAETEQPKTQAIEIVRFLLQDKATSGVWYVAEGSSQYVEGIRSAGIYEVRELSRTTVEIPAAE